MKTGIVFEGGAFRTIFSCGVMDAFLDRDIMPDYMIGVSAGAAYGVSYASRQKRRNLHAKIVIKNIKSNNKYQKIFCLFVFFHYICSESILKKAWCMRLALSQNNYATLEMRKKLSYRGN